MLYRKRRQPAGVTLIELTIAISIFSVVMMIVFDAFLNVLKDNREAVNKQTIQDHTEFLLSLMNKEIRTAKINYDNKCQPYYNALSDTANVSPNGTYGVVNNGRELRFENYEGLCVRYFAEEDSSLGGDRLKIARHNPATNETKESWVLPLNIEISNLEFFAQNKFDQRQVDSTGLLQPPLVKISLGLRSSIFNPSDVLLYSEVVGRNIEQF